MKERTEVNMKPGTWSSELVGSIASITSGYSLNLKFYVYFSSTLV